ncbi:MULTISPECIES: efflux transporter outer membrane subunit [Methylobacterium]|uniref:RND efflux system, outer membrane lipoprotein, NodT family n=1 Tax=Methylobacterium radiotolerans (strain ATCC 27329 / DSM 1819 / JCM 2831 / NBRC 15690 / NCIMB 10815 / 0-1) TaxID=426355 RepID=B1LX75_METRJ|nr:MULTISPECIES: efflux transporter outer membrane subunit [Methylobacterium]ACB27196.1 RND efflux system, outer membrane lipoprotein, NodT family [Methylobacterium radiotolerans JCM 2831]SFI81004.1 efflux transporter, outer membrane factor (OMF) lipoprotein, NodT family [Methylobacterium brachiatum]
MTLSRYLGRRGRAMITAGLLGLAGCTVGPDFAPLATPLADAGDYLDTGLVAPTPRRLLARTIDAEPDVAWWLAFRDPVLAQLEDRLAAQNLDVQTTTARLFQSRSQINTAAAAGLPTLNGQGSAYRQQFSKNGTIGLLSNSLGSLTGGSSGASSGNLTAPLTNGFESYTLGFDASWELDLWGKVRRSVESAEAQADASAEARRDALISGQAELARAYVQLRGTQELIRIDLANIRVNEQILDVVRVRQQKGLVTGLDTSSAAQQVEAIKAQLPQLQQQEIQQINAISLLLGEPPLALSQELVAGPSIPPVPPRIPIGVPSSLVMRRPDIRRAEANLHSAVAEIGVAEAQFFPSVTLTGSPTVNSVDPGKLFRGSSLQYMNIGPSISIPLFEGGRLKSNLVLQRARQQEAAIAYQKAVLQGWHDVVNALAALRGDEARRARLARQVADARQALALSRARYVQGVEIFTTVLQASQTVLQAETSLSQATAAISTDFVALSKALGGGWETTFPVGRTPPLSLAKVGIPLTDVVHDGALGR